MFNFFSLLSIFIYSGLQRTQVLLVTKAHQILKDPNKRFEEVELAEEFDNDIKPYTSWKWVLVLYELAIWINVFHTVLFWLRWREEVFEYYRNREPHTRSNVIVRVTLAHCINIIPPVLILIEFIFNKVVFSYRHVFVPILFIIVYELIVKLGDNLIEEGEIPDQDQGRYGEPLFMLWALAIMAGTYCGLTFFTHLRYYAFRDKLGYKGQDFLNALIK